MGGDFTMGEFGDELDPETVDPTDRQVLLVELVPSSSWGANLRSRLAKSDWDRLRRACYRAAGHRCEICAGKGRKHPVECHEVWTYDDDTGVQTLERLIALCPACHSVKHIGLAQLRGRLHQATAHLARVNGWSTAAARQHVSAAFAKWGQRSRRDWVLDLTWLQEHGVDVKPDK